MMTMKRELFLSLRTQRAVNGSGRKMESSTVFIDRTIALSGFGSAIGPLCLAG
jgi:hypothetical protein